MNPLPPLRPPRKAKSIAMTKLTHRPLMPLDARELACPQLPNVQVRIGSSHIKPAGTGMYLLRGPNNDGSADVGTRIATYDGPRYTSPEDHRRLLDPSYHSDYLFEGVDPYTGTHYIIDGSAKDSYGPFMNDGLGDYPANCTLEFGEDGKLYVVLIAPMEPHEEAFYQYGEPFWTEPRRWSLLDKTIRISVNLLYNTGLSIDPPTRNPIQVLQEDFGIVFSGSSQVVEQERDSHPTPKRSKNTPRGPVGTRVDRTQSKLDNYWAHNKPTKTSGIYGNTSNTTETVTLPTTTFLAPVSRSDTPITNKDIENCYGQSEDGTVRISLHSIGDHPMVDILSNLTAIPRNEAPALLIPIIRAAKIYYWKNVDETHYTTSIPNGACGYYTVMQLLNRHRGGPILDFSKSDDLEAGISLLLDAIRNTGLSGSQLESAHVAIDFMRRALYVPRIKLPSQHELRESTM